MISELSNSGVLNQLRLRTGTSKVLNPVGQDPMMEMEVAGGNYDEDTLQDRDIDALDERSGKA